MDKSKYLAEDEIDLRDYLNILIKRKILVLSIFLLSLVYTVVTTLLAPKVYEVSSTIQLGSINDILIKREEAKEMILNKNSLLSIIKELNLDIESESLKKSIKIEDITNTNLLRISMKSSNVDTGIKIISLIPSNFIAQGQSVFQQRINLINERLTELESEIKNVQDNIVRTQQLIIGISNASDISQVDQSLKIILLQNTIPNYETNLTALRNQRNELKVLLSIAREFKVFDAAIKPKYPLAQNIKQNVPVSGIVGFFFGVVLAFFVEFLQKCKEKRILSNEKGH